MNGAFTFLHCSDLHLGGTFSRLESRSADVAHRLGNAPNDAFRFLVEYAIKNHPAFLLIAGDVFDREDPDLKSLLTFRDGLRQCKEAGIPVFCSPGNHDPLTSPAWSRFDFRAEMTIFGEAPETFDIKRNGEVIARISGIAHARRGETSDLSARLPDLPPGPEPRIALLHANAGGQPDFEPYAPASISELAGRGYDYWALGHIHEYRVLRETAPAIVYSGCTQGRSVHEPGRRGFLMVTVKPGKQFEPEFVESDRIRVETICPELPKEAPGGLTDLENILTAALPRNSDRPLLLRVELTGETALDTPLRAFSKDELEDWCEELLQKQNRRGEFLLESVQLETRPRNPRKCPPELDAVLTRVLRELENEKVLENALKPMRKTAPGALEFSPEELEKIRQTAKTALIAHLLK